MLSVFVQKLIKLFVFFVRVSSQLCLVIDLYDPSEVHKYICPMAFSLADDRVAAVRQASVHLVKILACFNLYCVYSVEKFWRVCRLCMYADKLSALPLSEHCVCSLSALNSSF
jgi:hypothetical protein